MKIPNYLSELKIGDFKKVDFYLPSTFISVHEVVTTHDDEDSFTQRMFNVVAFHNYDYDSFDMEANILSSILEKLGRKQSKTLAKISSCQYWFDKYSKIEQEKIEEMSERCAGKWYFFPDQRTEIEDIFCEKNPDLACKVLPFSKYDLPETSHLNRYATEIIGSTDPSDFDQNPNKKEDN